MEIVVPTSEVQLEYCCKLYHSMNDPDFIQVDLDVCQRNIVEHWRRSGYVRLIVQNRQCVGFIMATLCNSKHSKERYLLQEYYCTNLKGFAAARAVRLAHRDMVQFARSKRIVMLMSCGSHNDPEQTFTRILERDGWKRKGHVAILRFESWTGRMDETPREGTTGRLSRSAPQVSPVSQTEARPVPRAALSAPGKDGNLVLGMLSDLVEALTPDL